MDISLDEVFSKKSSQVENKNLIDGKVLDQLLLIDKIRQKISEKVIVICNKCDDEDIELDIQSEVYSLGFKDHLMISAQFGNGMHQIWENLLSRITQEKATAHEQCIQERKRKIKRFKKQFEELVNDYIKEFQSKEEESIDWKETDVNFQKMKKKGRHLDKDFYLEEFYKLNRGKEYDSDLDDDEIPIENILKTPRLLEEKGISFNNPHYNNKIEVAIIGRPNAGKSTLMNKWIGRTVSLVDDKSHTTRDVSSGSIKVQNRKIELVDTAGISKSLKQSNNELDRMSYFKTRKKIQIAQIHVILGKNHFFLKPYKKKCNYKSIHFGRFEKKILD